MIPQPASYWPTGSPLTPMTHVPQPSSDREDFLRHVGENCLPAVDDTLPPTHTRIFVPTSALRNYLTSSVIRKLLVNDTPTGANWRQIQQEYLVVFAILISIDRAIYLKVFLNDHHLSDSNLPFDHCHNWPSDCRDFFQKFQDAQWQFCAQKLEANRLNGRQMDRRVILPIKSKRLIKRGVFSTAFEVEIYSEYNFLVGRDENGEPITNTFFLKTCVPDEAECHHKEIEAYNYLSDQEDILPYLPQYHGSWVQDQSYNMLLQYVGGGTLTQFMERTEAPVDSQHILQVWTGLLNLIKPLMRIHSLRHVYKGDRELRGIHHDIKPDNILVTESTSASVFDVTFKLADLGLTDFNCVQERMKKGTSKNNHGTQMCSPPELCVEDDDKFLQRTILDAESSKDIWALGCVFSEAAAWAVTGKAGLDEYRSLRTAATQNIPGLRQTSHVGCFHDGTKVLKEVCDLHLQILKRKRQCDHIIERVLDLVNQMLGEASSRPSAKYIYERSRYYLNMAKGMREDEPSTVGGQNYKGIFTLPDLPGKQVPPIQPPELREQGLNLIYTPHLEHIPTGVTGERSRSHIFSPSFSDPYRYLPNTNPFLPLSGWTPHLSLNPNPDTTQLPPEGEASPHSTSSQRGSVSPKVSRRSVNFKTSEADIPVLDARSPPNNEGSAAATPRITNQQPSKHKPHEQRRERFPENTIGEIEKWIKEKGMRSCVPDLPGMDRLKSLNGRDQIFLVDDSRSMAEYSMDVRRAVEVLGHLVKRKDPDGMELRFTNDPSFKARSKNRRRLIACLGNVRFGGQCDISQTLGQILKGVETDNAKNIKKRLWGHKKKKKVGINIYVLTDGIWEDGDDWLPEIVDSLRRLIDGGLKKGELGIEFIQFGSDPTGTQRLRTLDDELQKHGVEKDFIDTEPFDGNVYKMLLGSTHPAVDRQVTRPLSMPNTDNIRSGSLDSNESARTTTGSMKKI